MKIKEIYKKHRHPTIIKIDKSVSIFRGKKTLTGLALIWYYAWHFLKVGKLSFDTYFFVVAILAIVILLKEWFERLQRKQQTLKLMEMSRGKNGN